MAELDVDEATYKQKFEIGKLRNTSEADAEGVNLLEEWTNRGYDFKDNELVKTVTRKERRVVGWEYKRKEVGLTKFREESVAVGAKPLKRAIREELRARGLDWTLRDWWDWAAGIDETSIRGRPAFKWGGTKSRMRQFSDFRWEPTPKKVRERRNLREKVEREGKYNVKIMPAIPFPETEVEEVTEEHRIPITRFGFEARVDGLYIDSSGKEGKGLIIKGTKVVEAGVVPPAGVDEDAFWENMWKTIRDEIFPYEGKIRGSDLVPDPTADNAVEVNGRWINRVMRRSLGMDEWRQVTGGLAGENIPKGAKWWYWYNAGKSELADVEDFKAKMSSEASERGVYR